MALQGGHDPSDGAGLRLAAVLTESASAESGTDEHRPSGGRSESAAGAPASSGAPAPGQAHLLLGAAEGDGAMASHGGCGTWAGLPVEERSKLERFGCVVAGLAGLREAELEKMLLVKLNWHFFEKNSKMQRNKKIK